MRALQQIGNKLICCFKSTAKIFADNFDKFVPAKVNDRKSEPADNFTAQSVRKMQNPVYSGNIPPSEFVKLLNKARHTQIGMYIEKTKTGMGIKTEACHRLFVCILHFEICRRKNEQQVTASDGQYKITEYYTMSCGCDIITKITALNIFRKLETQNEHVAQQPRIKSNGG